MKVILLAAGKSSRTSTMKQLYRVGDEYLINIQIKILHSYGFDVGVVLGHHYEKISKILNDNITLIHNENYEDGMFSSVKKAFYTLDDDALIFCHIDRPIPDLLVFKQLLQSVSPVAVAFYNGKKAPPIYIHSSLKEQLLQSKYQRLDHWIETRNRVEYVNVNDAKVHYNANTDEELAAYFNVKFYDTIFR
ncbi:MAG: NTP transferase domain-containing protein [Campylobacterota bacterium]|nr:NTP transferase domain-containing protein [Campylobacterota bacterium]